MTETLRKPMTALSPDSSNVKRNMRTVGRQLKEARSAFRLAGAGAGNCEKTALSMPGQKLTRQKRAVQQHSRAPGRRTVS